MTGDLLSSLLEAFSAPAAPPVTVAQSNASGARQVAQAKAQIAAGWDESKHPRAEGGKFASKGGKSYSYAAEQKRYSAEERKYKQEDDTSRTHRTVNTGASGSLVSSIQRQLHVPVTGQYTAMTKEAVARYQRQHGLMVDGVVGRQTLAALSGHSNPASVSPGEIAAASAILTPAKLSPKAPVSMGGGVVIR